MGRREERAGAPGGAAGGGTPRAARAPAPAVPGRVRDAAARRALLEALLAVWERHPALRLGQLIGNALAGRADPAVALYFCEDEPLLAAIVAAHDEPPGGR